MNWARRLKRVFGIEIERCARCCGQLKIIASIEDPQVIAKILSHLERTAPDQYEAGLPLGVRAPPDIPEFSWRSGGLAWPPDLSGKSCRR